MTDHVCTEEHERACEAAARREERERCARLADAEAAEAKRDMEKADNPRTEALCWTRHQAAKFIASLIREDT